MLTSDWEGFGLVAFEALSLGVPCVVSDVGGLSQIIDNECGMLCKQKKDYINECIVLLDNGVYMNQKHRKAIKKSKFLENYDGYIKKIDKYYKTMEEK